MTDPRPTRPRAARLRAVLLWGNSVVCTTHLPAGRSLTTETPGWAVPSAEPLPWALAQAQRTGWQVDCSAATRGTVRDSSGRSRPTAPGEQVSMATPGDLVLLRYGDLAVLLEVVRSGPAVPRRLFIDPLLAAGAGFATVAVAGGMALVFALTSSSVPSRPPSLQHADELARRYYVDASSLAGPPAPDPPARVAPPRSSRSSSPIEAALVPAARSAGKGTLSPIEVNAVLLRSYAIFEDCVEVAGDDAQGSVDAEVTVGPNGAVRDVRLLDDRLGDELSQCVGDRLRRLEFPTAASATRARFALRLKP